MPNRILRPGINSSDRVNALSAAAEVFYRRLMSVVDDYGRFDGDWRVLRAQLYPLRTNEITQEQIELCLTECCTIAPGQDEPLVQLYFIARRRYVVLLNFGQPIRTRSKWPPPPEGFEFQSSVSEPPSAPSGGTSSPNANLRAGCEQAPAIECTHARVGNAFALALGKTNTDTDTEPDTRARDHGNGPGKATRRPPERVAATTTNGKSPPGRPTFAEALANGLVKNLADYRGRFGRA